MKSKVKFETSIIRALKDQSKVHVVMYLCPDFEKDYCAYAAKRLFKIKSCSPTGAPDFEKDHCAF